ncbi:hypothetical protein [Burkholderia sp. Nafp2/4-1b]|uniref:hypothetical protein n=1 Tax=Burkholderia sp. Nafp2/4-1b TaxID=2116686 RepID=UPI0013CE95C5|nr:hypothetical protein [Burkholderia sp. Nafp2/4-1b]
MNRLEQLDQWNTTVLGALERCAEPIALCARQFSEVSHAPTPPHPERDELTHDDCPNETRMFLNAMSWLAASGFITYSKQSADNFTGVKLTRAGRHALSAMRQRGLRRHT